jgi:hypothetical protein
MAAVAGIAPRLKRPPPELGAGAATTKRCPRCKLVYEAATFARDVTRRDGLNRLCKSCDRIRRRELGYPPQAGPVKACKRCGSPTATAKHTYCAACGPRRRVDKRLRRERGTSTQRGYGRDHQLVRARVAPLVAAGLARCWRCGGRIAVGERWDLGHVDGGGPSEYAGPEHAACNRATAGREAARRRRQRRTTSRAW